MSWVQELLEAQLQIGDLKPILWREIVGNVFGLASAILGMRRSFWAWPVGIVGNVLLFTVFLGGVFNTPQAKDLWGQAGRQVFFIAISIYGLVRWYNGRKQHVASDGGAIVPRWASWKERFFLLLAGFIGFYGFTWVLTQLGSWGPQPDAWILTGSILATYGMARGYVEFWLIWIAVDAVGVPLLIRGEFYPSAVLYLVYAFFVILGFFTWWRVQRKSLAEQAPPDKQPEAVPV